MNIDGNALQQVAFEIQVASKDHESERVAILIDSFQKEFVKFQKEVNATGLQES